MCHNEATGGNVVLSKREPLNLKALKNRKKEKYKYGSKISFHLLQTCKCEKYTVFFLCISYSIDKSASRNLDREKLSTIRQIG